MKISKALLLKLVIIFASCSKDLNSINKMQKKLKQTNNKATRHINITKQLMKKIKKKEELNKTQEVLKLMSETFTRQPNQKRSLYKKKQILDIIKNEKLLYLLIKILKKYGFKEINNYLYIDNQNKKILQQLYYTSIFIKDNDIENKLIALSKSKLKIKAEKKKLHLKRDQHIIEVYSPDIFLIYDHHKDSIFKLNLLTNKKTNIIKTNKMIDTFIKMSDNCLFFSYGEGSDYELVKIIDIKFIKYCINKFYKRNSIPSEICKLIHNFCYYEKFKIEKIIWFYFDQNNLIATTNNKILSISPNQQKKEIINEENFYVLNNKFLESYLFWKNYLRFPYYKYPVHEDGSYLTPRSSYKTKDISSNKVLNKTHFDSKHILAQNTDKFKKINNKIINYDSQKHKINIYDIETGLELETINLEQILDRYEVGTFSKNGKFLSFIDSDFQQIIIYSLNKQRIINIIYTKKERFEWKEGFHNKLKNYKYKWLDIDNKSKIIIYGREYKKENKLSIPFAELYTINPEIFIIMPEIIYYQ